MNSIIYSSWTGLVNFVAALCLALSPLSLNANGEGPILSSELHLSTPTILERTRPGHLPPGAKALLHATIKNIGKKTSPPIKTFIRFAFPKPFDQEKESELFRTETQAVPPLEPGQELKVDFTTPQLLPALRDFFLNDWPMRLYESIVEFENGREIVIGSLSLTFSAYYYEGPSKSLPKSLPDHF